MRNRVDFWFKRFASLVLFLDTFSCRFEFYSPLQVPESSSLSVVSSFNAFLQCRVPGWIIDECHIVRCFKHYLLWEMLGAEWRSGIFILFFHELGVLWTRRKVRILNKGTVAVFFRLNWQSCFWNKSTDRIRFRRRLDRLKGGWQMHRMGPSKSLPWESSFSSSFSQPDRNKTRNFFGGREEG